MRKISLVLAILCYAGINILSAGELPVTINRDQKTETYTFVESGLPVLSYHFGVVPFPADQKPKFFSKGAKPYSGSYFTDGSRYGGERSDYIQPIYGFKGEVLTEDFPSDHQHHRGLWWSWCEVRWNERIGDLWAVNKIRAYPVGSVQQKSDAGGATLEAVNVWRYDGDPTEVVRETVTIRVHKTTGQEGSKNRNIDIRVKLDALVDGIAITGRQNCAYCGYGGMAVRMVPEATEMSLRVVHPKPDSWRGADLKMAQVFVNPEQNGQAAWLSIHAKYPLPGQKEVLPETGFTTLTMLESMKNELAPSDFRYYSSRNIMIAFPGFDILPIKKGVPCVFDCRFRVSQGKTDFATDKAVWEEYQKEQ